MAEGVSSCESNLAKCTQLSYWDSDDDGVNLYDLYGRHTWKITNFSQIKKREIRSTVFEVGGCEWYVLLYPQGCDVCNYISLFLCVANHDKLLPGWSYLAQFTMSVANREPKRSKYSDTLHRFWKKEHDWGWKKFLGASKLEVEGFVGDDSLVVRVQVQVIRERPDGLFRCLKTRYRVELMRVYSMNVESILRLSMEEHRTKLGMLLEDRSRWSSFCALWSGMDKSSRCLMSREEFKSIMKLMVKRFFIEKEVTSTLVMESLYTGLKALEHRNKGKKRKGKYLEVEESRVPIVGIENDAFVLVDDVLLLIERVAKEPLPLKDEKDHRDGIEHDKRLGELGCRTIEMFVFHHIFSKIEVAYQERVALNMQEDLIREVEAISVNQIEQKSKPGVDKGKKFNAKQGNRDK